MENWIEAREMILSVVDDSPRWKSQSKHLLQIFAKAKEWQIDPSVIQGASLSNLREIIREARVAIKNGEKTRLENLLHQAATMTNTNLRVELRGERLRKVKVRKVPREKGYAYYFRIDEDLFERIKNGTHGRLRFSVKELDNDSEIEK